MSDSLYSLRGLEFSYTDEAQGARALSDVNLEIPKGAFLCLTGPSGSGKTTLLNLLGLIEKVQKGDLLFRGRNFKGLTEKDQNRIRRFEIGFIFQQFQLFPVLRADENVEYFLSRQGIPAEERANRVRQALEAVGLWEHRQKRPLEMSGGQRQRVAVARALAKRPEVIIADEPTASLDQSNGKGIMELLKELNRTLGLSVILSSHDPMVLQYVEKQIHLVDGRVVERSA